MQHKHAHRPWLSLAAFIVGVLLTIIACGLLIRHARLFSLKRDTAVMIGTTLPELKSTVALLDANRQAEDFFAENALISREEQASVYVLPDSPSTARAVTALQEIARAIQATGGRITVSSISFDNDVSDKVVRSHLQLSGDYASIAQFFAVLSFSGDMLVRDIMADDAAEAFLRLVENTAPTSLKHAADFLYSDVLLYAAEPDKSEQNMLRDVPTEAEADIRSLLLQSGLASVRGAFDGIAQTLQDKAVWPLPLMSLDHLQRDGELWSADVLLYRR